MGDEEGEADDADQQGVGVEQPEEGPGVCAVVADGYSAYDVADGDAEEQGG